MEPEKLFQRKGHLALAMNSKLEKEVQSHEVVPVTHRVLELHLAPCGCRSVRDMNQERVQATLHQAL